MISKNCFRLVELRNEVQNNAQVLKPILDEHAIVRLCQKDDTVVDDWNLLTSSEVDEAIREFLSQEIEESDVISVVSFFGKQKDIRARFEELNWWPLTLKEQDQGIYALRVTTAVKGAPLVVLFSWIHDFHFQISKIRENAAHILRFMSCVSTEIVCCLSAADFNEIDALMQSDTQTIHWHDYSVKLSVQKQHDDEDNVNLSVKNKHMLPITTEYKDIQLIKGSDAAVMVSREVLNGKGSTFSSHSFSGLDDLVGFIAQKSESYRIEFNYTFFENKELRKKILQGARFWPEDEIAFQVKTSIDDIQFKKEEMLNAINQKYYELRQSAEILSDFFLCEYPKLDFLPDFDDFYRELTQLDGYNYLTQKEKNVLNLPKQFQSSLNDLLFQCRFGYDSVLYDNFSRLQKGEDIRRIPWVGTAWNYLVARRRSEQEMQIMILPRIQSLRVFYMQFFEQLIEKHKETEKRKMEVYATNKMEERKPIIQQIIQQHWETYCESFRNNDLLLKLSNLRRTSCRIETEFFKDRQIRYKWCNINSTKVEEKPHEFELIATTDTRYFFTLNLSLLLLVIVSDCATTIQTIKFTESYYEGNTSSCTLVKKFPKSALHCDFHFKEKMIAFTFGKSNALMDLAANIYRFNDSFTTMECTKTIAIGVKGSLSNPIKSILFSTASNDNGLILVDEKGITQTISFRSSQASKKVCLIPNEIENVSFIQLHENEVIGIIYAVPPTPNTQEMQSLSIGLNSQILKEQRSLPDVYIELSVVHQPVDPEDITAINIGEKVYVLQKSTATVYTLETFIEVQTDSYRIQRSKNNKCESLRTKEHWLWIFFDIYEKFPVCGLLGGARDASAHISILGPKLHNPEVHLDSRMLSCES